MIEDQPQRMIAIIRELDGRLWSAVLAGVISNLLTTASFDLPGLLAYLAEHVDEPAC